MLTLDALASGSTDFTSHDFVPKSSVPTWVCRHAHIRTAVLQILLPISQQTALSGTDGMFKGIYNGKQYHIADIGAVLKRAWEAGVDRIISLLYLGKQVTGGSLKESKEALAIAETDDCRPFPLHELLLLNTQGVHWLLMRVDFFAQWVYILPDARYMDPNSLFRSCAILNLGAICRAQFLRALLMSIALTDWYEITSIHRRTVPGYEEVGAQSLKELSLLWEFEESGNPEQHFQELVSLAREGVERGKKF
eukprot:Gb_27108 [translate_table: standard]